MFNQEWRSGTTLRHGAQRQGQRRSAHCVVDQPGGTFETARVQRGISTPDRSCGWLGAVELVHTLEMQTRMHQGNRVGNGCFHSDAAGVVRNTIVNAGIITCIRAWCSRPCVLPSRQLGSAKHPAAIPSVIPSPGICWSRDQTSARFRNSLVTRM